MPRIIPKPTQPSIYTLLVEAPTVQHTAMLRNVISIGLSNGKLDPTPVTARSWERALWLGVVRQMLSAGSIENASFVFNTVLPWDEPQWAEKSVHEAFGTIKHALRQMQPVKTPSVLDRVDAHKPCAPCLQINIKF